MDYKVFIIKKKIKVTIFLIWLSYKIRILISDIYLWGIKNNNCIFVRREWVWEMKSDLKLNREFVL